MGGNHSMARSTYCEIFPRPLSPMGRAGICSVWPPGRAALPKHSHAGRMAHTARLAICTELPIARSTLVVEPTRPSIQAPRAFSPASRGCRAARHTLQAYKPKRRAHSYGLKTASQRVRPNGPSFPRTFQDKPAYPALGPAGHLPYRELGPVGQACHLKWRR